MSHRTFVASFAFVARVALVIGVGAIASAACATGEGERCNPDLVDSNECAGNLTCTTLPNCAVSFCCPATVGENDPQQCSVCPAINIEDAGAPEGGGD